MFFPFNKIPSNLIDPVAKALFNSKFYPAPINDQLENNQNNTSRNFTHGDQGDVKIDYNRSQKDRIFGRFSRSRQDRSGTNSFPLFFDDFFRAPAYKTVDNRTPTVTPTCRNETQRGP